MNVIKDDHQEIQENSEQWLSLCTNPTDNLKNSTLKKQPVRAKKIFSCNYCKRKFYNSQALGGHQNAHKRERGQNHKMMIRSLGVHVHSHSIVNKLSSRDNNGRFNEMMNHSRFGNDEEEATDSSWPGSFRLDHQYNHSTKLDLNLKL